MYDHTSTKGHNDKLPYEVLFCKVPDNLNLHVFCFKASVYVHEEQGRKKIWDRSRFGILLAHSDGMYRVQILVTHNVIKSKHVTFSEREFPMRRSKQLSHRETVYFEVDLEENMPEEDAGEDTRNEQVRSPTEEEQSAVEIEELRYVRREHHMPERFVAGAMRRTHIEEEPTKSEALRSKEKPKSRAAIDNKVNALEEIRC